MVKHMLFIKYTKIDHTIECINWKYYLEETYCIFTNIKPKYAVVHKYFELDTNGFLIIKQGYCWDGASGTFDTKNIMRASLVHDCVYQMIRTGLLSYTNKGEVDKLFHIICKEDGMNYIYAKICYWMVSIFGDFTLTEGYLKLE